MKALGVVGCSVLGRESERVRELHAGWSFLVAVACACCTVIFFVGVFYSTVIFISNVYHRRFNKHESQIKKHSFPAFYGLAFWWKFGVDPTHKKWVYLLSKQQIMVWSDNRRSHHNAKQVHSSSSLLNKFTYILVRSWLPRPKTTRLRKINTVVVGYLLKQLFRKPCIVCTFPRTTTKANSDMGQ